MLQQALLLCGKDLGKKSLFPAQFRAIQFQKTTQLFCRLALILRERVRVVLRHTVPAMAETLLANLLLDAERIHCRGVRVTEGVPTN